MRNKLKIIIFILLLGFVSCDRSKCINNNPIFEQNAPDSKIYKDELVHQLKTIDPSKLRYWLQKYEEQKGKEFLYFHIQNEDLCAILVLSMKEWNKLEDVRKGKGVSYRGAEFTNLQFEIQSDSLTTEFIYTTHDSILD